MHTFPFGQPVKPVEQQDQSARAVFVLGVYASAVHARWVGDDGVERIKAVGVASEPEIFWTGERAAELIGQIPIPQGMGRLEAASPQFNGPSGRSLDELFLTPLGLDRSQAWLCDLLPESRCNPSQARALEREYAPRQWGLPTYSWPPVPKTLANEERISSIVDEVVRSRAEYLVTLGDQPLRFFARHFGAHSTLRAYGTTDAEYGRPVPLTVGGHRCGLIPLVHPRQASSLGRSSREWSALHRSWVDRQAQ